MGYRGYFMYFPTPLSFRFVKHLPLQAVQQIGRNLDSTPSNTSIEFYSTVGLKRRDWPK